MLKRLRSNRGQMDPLTVAVIGSVAMITAVTVGGTALTYVLAGKEQAKANISSIWAHVQGKCTGGYSDSRCIMK